MIGTFRSAGWKRRWLAVALLALLADLSASMATHRHVSHGSAPAVLEQPSAPTSRVPIAPLRDMSIEDVCAICGALAGGVATCTTRAAIDLDATLGGILSSLRAPVLLVASEWWDSTASRAPPRTLSPIH